jgi:hypothetical protein
VGQHQYLQTRTTVVGNELAASSNLATVTASQLAYPMEFLRVIQRMFADINLDDVPDRGIDISHYVDSEPVSLLIDITMCVVSASIRSFRGLPLLMASLR